MPEIIIKESAMRAGGAKNRIDRRQALPRHGVDDRDLGMIENRVGEVNRVTGTSSAGSPRPAPAPAPRRRERPPWYRRRGVGIGVRRELERRDADGDAERRDGDDGKRRKSDQKENRQRCGAMDRPTHDRRSTDRQRPRQQMAGQRIAQQAPKRGRQQRAESSIDGRCHGASGASFPCNVHSARRRGQCRRQRQIFREGIAAASRKGGRGPVG